VTGYNQTVHSALLGMSPQEVINQQSSLNMQRLQKSRTRKNINLEQYLKERKKNIDKSQWWIGQYVRLILEPKDVFQKKSVMTKIGTELFKVSRSRPSKSDVIKDPLLTLTDMTNEIIDGVFRLNEVKLVPINSQYHPSHPSFKKTITQVHKVTTKKRLKFFEVSYAGISLKYLLITLLGSTPCVRMATMI
jgi:hypothetical protein